MEPYLSLVQPYKASEQTSENHMKQLRIRRSFTARLSGK